MITKELRTAIEKIETLREGLKNMHLLELLPQLLENQQKLIDYIEKTKDDSKSFKEKINTK